MALPIIGAVAGGLISALGARSAARAQTRAANQQMDLARETRDLQRQDLAPWVQSGGQANDALMFDMGLGPQPQGYAGFEGSPGFQFALDQAGDALQGSAAARGGLLSGRTVNALGQQAVGYAQQDYGNHINRLSGISGMGASAAAGQATAAGQAGQAINQAIGDRGNAQAAGYQGMANALTGGINNYLTGWQYQTMRPQQVAGTSRANALAGQDIW